MGRILIHNLNSYHAIHCLVLIQHLRMILFFNLNVSQEFAHATVTKGKQFVVICS